MAVPWKKIGIVLVAILILLPALAISATVGWRVFLLGPRARPLQARSFEPTPARLERGRYLVESVYVCVACHSERDWKASGRVLEAKKAAGVVWSMEGMPWLTAPNLTPDKETGIGALSDDAVARAVREGIGHDGRALFPLMPYGSYRRIPDEDLASIVVYLRSLPPVRNPLPKTQLPFPVSFFIQAAPEPLEGPVPPPDLSTPVRRGEYLVRTIECAGCHTPMRQGQPIAELDLAGGQVFPAPGGGTIAMTNLTPDPSGIPYYDEDLFVQVMRTGKVKGRELSPVMPWPFFAGMTDEDLRAIFAYLRTIKPVSHHVSNTDPPTDCARCGYKHGLGERNTGAL
jgi:mono/diheme cytochrome c family protein